MFLLKSVNILNYISTFPNTNPSLHFWNNLYLVMDFYYFNVLPHSGCCYLIEIFYITEHKFHCIIVFFFCKVFVRFWYQCCTDII